MRLTDSVPLPGLPATASLPSFGDAGEARDGPGTAGCYSCPNAAPEARGLRRGDRRSERLSVSSWRTYLREEDAIVPRDGRYDDVTAFLDARGDALLRTAVLLTPGRESGQDLLQEALERMLRKWHKVNGDPEGYLRRIMYNRAVDGWRSRARRPEVLGLPAEVAVADHASQLDLRLTLIAALELLTPRQRAAVCGALLGAAQRGGDRGSARLLG